MQQLTELAAQEPFLALWAHQNQAILAIHICVYKESTSLRISRQFPSSSSLLFCFLSAKQ
jgi:hypothetical protein